MDPARFDRPPVLPIRERATSQALQSDRKFFRHAVGRTPEPGQDHATPIELNLAAAEGRGSVVGDAPEDALTNDKCRAAFQTYVGVEYRRSILTLKWTEPSAGNWKSGDRHVFCVAFDPAGQRTGTVRHFGR